MLYGQAFRESRCSGGMYYTSIKNIYKVIDLLFLNSVKAELEELLYMNILSDGTMKNLSMNFS